MAADALKQTHKASRQLANWTLDIAVDGRINPGDVITELIKEVQARHALAQDESMDYSEDELEFWGAALDGVMDYVRRPLVPVASTERFARVTTEVR